MFLPSMLEGFMFLLIAIAGLVGAALAAMTREDAFDAANRQSKWIWVAILAGSGLVCLTPIPILPWVGAVAIGLYYFDVRPQISNILRGNFGW
ncbi:DUF2516 family protein [Corynebacterium breve]|uniref:DUF2516 family protein n=1 Tax=Corynebacterium breve TaxID=3049799 RepID=A0ABY8VIT4_9CORY|nr:DUF2516 family protein [Corynebacterium breve]WIM68977.1 DUF2516 family protein [Corynebacterium breve]